VVGVIKDFILHSPYQQMKPIVIEGSKGWFNVMHIKLGNTSSVSQNMAAIEKIFRKYNPQYPFVSAFTDQEYDKKFQSEKLMSSLAGLFAGLTIFISCLGLFGLAAYMAENRIKEIGVRKILGASVINITGLLSKEFIKLIVVAILIAVPIGWWLAYQWLQDFSYRTTISWWLFAAAGILAIVIALITVSSQAIRAALSNPVNSLRTE
jgi:ABC-type antimicrobial peptide transport system permease subunit